MPIRRLLGGGNFDPESLRVIIEAYDGAVRALNISADPQKEVLAVILFKFAASKRTALDVDELRDQSVAAMKALRS